MRSPTARRNGDNAAAARWLHTADAWEASLERWTVTENGTLELAAGRSARHRLAAIAATANDGFMMPEPVWEDTGEGTLSATPLTWTHAQFVRLARSIDPGRPVEQPSIVACRYLKECDQ